MNILDFKTVGELKAYAKVNGYDAGAIDGLVAQWEKTQKEEETKTKEPAKTVPKQTSTSLED